MNSKIPTLVSALFLSALAAAQTTDYCLPIGGAGSHGCQDPNAPVLTGNVVATADLEYLYDMATGVLTLVVTNTSPIVAGEENPVITRIAFNVPAGVTGASLVTQTGTGGATPNFALQFTPPGSIRMGCFGTFDAELAISGIAGAIGNAAAPSFSHPSVVLGPTTFALQLTGTGLGSLTAEHFAITLSQNGAYAVGAGMKFQGAGIGGEESGFVSSGAPCCPNTPQIIPVGTGCAPAPLAIPTLSSVGTPGLAVPFGVDIQSPSTPNSFGILLVGIQPISPVFGLPVPIDLSPFGLPGCTLYSAGNAAIGVVTDGSGDASWSIILPSRTIKWCNVPFDFQVFFAAGGGVLSSAGLTLVPGS